MRGPLRWPPHSLSWRCPLDEEVIVRIRFWEHSDEFRDEYYAVPRDQLERIRRAMRPHGEHSLEAAEIVRECGRKLEPELSVDVVEY